MIRYIIEDKHKVSILDHSKNKLFYFDPYLYDFMYDKIPEEYSEEYTRLVKEILETIVIYFLPKVERGDLFVGCNEKTK